jgi:hypothetical protein
LDRWLGGRLAGELNPNGHEPAWSPRLGISTPVRG